VSGRKPRPAASYYCRVRNPPAAPPSPPSRAGAAAGQWRPAAAP